jgi:hypothetical protein
MGEFSRPVKPNDAATILYEIDMVRFTANRLLGRQLESENDINAFLESFLLHYRNLIEFLGNEEQNIRKTDLHVSNIWEKSELSEPDRLPNIRERGNELWKDYARVDDSISRYLNHCTTYRTQPKSWGIGRMMQELEPLLTEVEKALRGSSPRSSANFAGSNSTATISGTLSEPIDIGLYSALHGKVRSGGDEEL